MISKRKKKFKILKLDFDKLGLAVQNEKGYNWGRNWQQDKKKPPNSQ